MIKISKIFGVSKFDFNKIYRENKRKLANLPK